jgi:ribonuclease VapC
MRPNVSVVPFDLAMARIAEDAMRRFGRGSGHPARLNFGDGLTYAVAMALGRPVLFKGADFGLTDALLHPASIRL